MIQTSSTMPSNSQCNIAGGQDGILLILMVNVSNKLGSKKLLIAVIQNGDKILMRKKPAGSPPYKETLYLFGCEPKLGQEDSVTLTQYARKELGINIHSIVPIGEDAEVKQDHDGLVKKFIYANFDCLYQDGTPKVPTGAERVEWIEKEKLHEYDVVPPSVKLFKKMGLY